MHGGGSIRYLSAVISEDNPVLGWCIEVDFGGGGGRILCRRKMEEGRGESGRGWLWGGGHSRKGAIDLLQKEAAVSGLFFNKSFEKQRERERERERETKGKRR